MRRILEAFAHPSQPPQADLLNTQSVLETVQQPLNAANLTPIPFEVQPPSVLLDQGRLALCSRFFIDLNTNGEELGLALCIDDTDYAYPYPIKTADRETVRVAFQVKGRKYSVRLTGALTVGQIEFYEAWAQIETGDEPQ
jgi:hypothetical protein